MQAKENSLTTDTTTQESTGENLTPQHDPYTDPNPSQAINANADTNTQDNTTQPSGQDTNNISQAQDTQTPSAEVFTSDFKEQEAQSEHFKPLENDLIDKSQDASFSQSLGGLQNSLLQTKTLNDGAKETSPSGGDLSPNIPLVETLFEEPSYNKDRDQELKALRDKLLNKIESNNNILVYTHYSLLGIAELIDISRDIFKQYSYHCDNLRIGNNAFSELKEQLKVSARFTNKSLLEIAKIHQTTQELYTQAEQILDTTQAEISTLNNKLDIAKQTLESIKQIKDSITEIESIQAQLSALLAQSQDIKLQIEILSQNILHNMQATLLSAKESFEAELYSKKEEYIALFNEKLTDMQNKALEFDIAYNKAKSEAAIASKQVEAFKEQLVKYHHQANITFINYLNHLSNANTEHLRELESFKDDKKAELETFKDAKQTDLEHYKDAKEQDLEAFKTQKENDLQAFKEAKQSELEINKENYKLEISNTKEDLLRDIAVLNTAEILHLRELFYTIQNNTAILGSNYQSITYTSDTTFTPIEGIKNYFVFIRGGNGATNAATSGGITSFGDLLSVSGGAGNTRGVGQRGESKGAFITLENENDINIVVSSGGICTISYAGSEALNYDFNFLVESDIAFLKAQNEDKEAFKARIKNTRDYNFYQSLVSIANGLNLENIKELEAGEAYSFNGTTLSSKRELALSVAREYLNNGTGGDINRLLESVSINTPSQATTQGTGTDQDNTFRALKPPALHYGD